MNKFEKLLINIVPIKRWRHLIRNTDATFNFFENVYNKTCNKKVLVSYITDIFQKKKSEIKAHTNFYECETACEIFDKLGYQVDVVLFSYTLSPEKICEYDVVYGFGRCFNLACMNPDILTIFYGTGCSVSYSNIKTAQKVIDFYKKTGVWCPDSSRYSDMDNELALNFAKYFIVLGNNFSKNTYKTNKSNVKNIDCFCFDVYNSDLQKKDFSKTKKNFLWFGSAGTLHKGLDILLEIFKRRTDLNLTVCGANPQEKGFFKYYKDVFDGKYENIKYYNFVDIESNLFKMIVDNSIAVIVPSVSEGGGVATLNCMANGGLIPLTSVEMSLDVSKYGYVFENISEAGVEACINRLINLSDKELFNLSNRVQTETKERYSFENYRKILFNNIHSAINEAEMCMVAERERERERERVIPLIAKIQKAA